MIRLLGLLALLPLAFDIATAADPADAQAVVAKAIQAIGGEAKLAKFKAQTWKEKGTFYGMGEGLPYEGNYAVQWPDQFKMEIVGVFTIVVNKDKGWIVMGQTNDMTKEQLAEQQESLHAGYVSSLTPLKDKAFQLTSVPESKVEGKPAVGVKVASKGRRDVILWFDRESGILVKSEHKSKAEDQGGALVAMENFYSDYKEVEGIKMPMKILMKRDGKRFVEAVNLDVKPVEQLPAKTFDKP